MKIINWLTCWLVALCFATVSAAQQYPSPMFNNFSGNTMRLGTVQTTIGQIGQITAPYAAGYLSTNSDIFRVQVGSIDPTFEVGHQSPSTQAIVCTIGTPAGSYSGTAGWPDACGGFYSVGYNTTKSSVALYTLGMVGASNSYAYGVNSSTVNCAGTTCGGTSGLDFNTMYSIEADTNVYSKSGVAPSGNAAGVVSILNATTQNTGSLSAFQVSHTAGMAQWKTGFSSNHGDAGIGISLGAVANAASSASQPINLVALDSSGNPQTGKIFTNSAGTLNLQVNGSTLQLLQTYPSLALVQNIAGNVGAKIYNSSTSGSATSNFILQTGNAGSTLSLGLTNGGAATILSGSGTTGLTLQPQAGAITLQGTTKVPSVTTGTPTASLCIDATATIIIKTTAGSCI